MSNSTHRVEVVPVELRSHPNADTLSLVQVFGYQVCVRTADWQGMATGAYVPPDSICPDTPDFAFLGEHRRIKVKRLRGEISQGLLVPAPEGAQVGDDVAEILGVTHYEPPLPVSTTGEAERPPSGYRPVYDLESARRYGAAVFEPGEPLFVTEKIHGANGRFGWTEEGGFHCGSRTEWKRESEDLIWWRALHAYPALKEFLTQNPDITVYGEVYGQVQDLHYGTRRGEIRLAVFDLLQRGKWLDPLEARGLAPMLPWAPTIAAAYLFDLEGVFQFAEGPSLMPGADHCREGCVAKPMQERTHPLVGRVCLKIVGNDYLMRKD